MTQDQFDAATEFAIQGLVDKLKEFASNSPDHAHPAALVHVRPPKIEMLNTKQEKLFIALAEIGGDIEKRTVPELRRKVGPRALPVLFLGHASDDTVIYTRVVALEFGPIDSKDVN